MFSIKRLENLVNKFQTLTPEQKAEAIEVFKNVIEAISDETVKNAFNELLEVMNEEIS